MPVATALVSAALVGETINFWTTSGSYDAANNADALQLVGCCEDGVAIDEENRRETHLFTIGNAEKFNLDFFALSDFFLFSAGGDDCVHNDFPSYKW